MPVGHRKPGRFDEKVRELLAKTERPCTPGGALTTTVAPVRVNAAGTELICTRRTGPALFALARSRGDPARSRR
jgi:hypothetical protein